MDILTSLRLLGILLSIAFQLPRTLKQIRQSPPYWEMRNTLADMRMKARGHVTPVIIERLDDGADPEHQHLRVDMARTFPQERIDKALYSQSSQSFKNMAILVLYAAIKQAAQNAQSGDERTTTVTLDVLSSGIRAIFTLHLQVDGNWQMVSRQIKVNLRQHFAAIRAKSDYEDRLRKEAKSQSKAQRK